MSVLQGLIPRLHTVGGMERAAATRQRTLIYYLRLYLSSHRNVVPPNGFPTFKIPVETSTSPDKNNQDYRLQMDNQLLSFNIIHIALKNVNI